MDEGEDAAEGEGDWWSRASTTDCCGAVAVEGAIGSPLHDARREACDGRPGPLRVFSFFRCLALRFWYQTCKLKLFQKRPQTNTNKEINSID